MADWGFPVEVGSRRLMSLEESRRLMPGLAADMDDETLDAFLLGLERLARAAMTDLCRNPSSTQAEGARISA